MSQVRGQVGETTFQELTPKQPLDPWPREAGPFFVPRFLEIELTISLFCSVILTECPVRNFQGTEKNQKEPKRTKNIFEIFQKRALKIFGDYE